MNLEMGTNRQRRKGYSRKEPSISETRIDVVFQTDSKAEHRLGSQDLRISDKGAECQL